MQDTLLVISKYEENFYILYKKILKNDYAKRIHQLL
jgi:hypothetical protein